MSGGGKSGGSQKTTTESKPPAWAKPLYEQSAHDAQQLYNDKSGFNVYQGSSVAPQSGTTRNALEGLGNTTYTPSGAASSAIGTAQTAAGGALAGQNQLEKMANGDFLADGNPYYRQALDRDIADTTAKLNSQFSGSGRYGSGANQQLVGKTAGNMLLDGLNANYTQERASQLQAAGLLGDRQNASVANNLSVANAANTVSNTNFQNQLTAGNTQLAAGQAVDKQNQLKLSDEIARFYANDNQDWTRLGALQAAAQGASGSYGTQVQNQQMQQASNPLGAIGLIGSLATKSDRRLKTNVVAVGITKTGFTLYEFDYVDRPGRWRGVMAQDVAERAPAAVSVGPGGFLAVHYALIGARCERIAA